MQTLEYWSRWFWAVLYDETRRRFRRKLVIRPITKKNGWACKIEGQWFAVRRSKNRLIFQCDGWSCDIDPALMCVLNRTQQLNTFCLTCGSDEIFRISYRPPKLGAFVDVTYDSLDQEADDFLFWVSILWQDAERRDLMVMNLIE